MQHHWNNYKNSSAAWRFFRLSTTFNPKEYDIYRVYVTSLENKYTVDSDSLLLFYRKNYQQLFSPSLSMELLNYERGQTQWLSNASLMIIVVLLVIHMMQKKWLY